MTLTEIALLLIAGAGMILVMVVVPAMVALKRAAEAARSLADMAATELRPTIIELNGAVADLKVVCKTMAENKEDLTRFLSALGETGNNLHTINNTVGAVTGLLGTASVWVTGAKVAGKYVLQRYLTNRGGK